jgi:hypothetical protein
MVTLGTLRESITTSSKRYVRTYNSVKVKAMATKSTTPSTTQKEEPKDDLNAKEFIDLLTVGEDGMKKEEATDIVNRLIPGIKQLMPRATTEERRRLLLVKIRDLRRVGEVDKFRGLCIAVDDMKDSLGYEKYKAREAYKANPARALKDGIVVKEGDKIVEMDTRKYKDKAQTKPNNNFGKPLPTIERREGFFIIDGKIIRAFGHFDAEIGHIYELFGNMGEGDILNINKTPSPRLVEALDDHAFWSQVYDICSNSEMATPLEQLPEVDKNKTVIITGIIQHVGVTGNQSAMIIVNNDEIPDGIAGFASHDAVGKEMEAMGKGAEVIVVGRVLKTKSKDGSGDLRTALNVMGIIQNPQTEGSKDVLGKLDEIAFR